MAKRKRIPCLIVRRGEPGWLEALATCVGAEKTVAMKFGIISFRPDDPRAESIEGCRQ